ncbi:hypothetical protein [Crocosphaera sp.]|uniref:hypothetical protein n=1 Tax=Crocosphaera sp. TaxID=2729996 RepID=UPI00260D0B09|nr:hypothetical protein [Crocosphaera sp.]MDJ0581663.1 hypothetical protein [Crocosphaera sp.]
MLLNDVTTQGQTVNLGQGVYQVKLFNLETIDPLDYIRIGGSNFQWRYQGQTQWMDGQFTEYADNINQSLIIELNVLDQTELTFRTDDTFDFPNDDTPTNPIIDIEVLQVGDNSSIIQDGIGAINNNILSTGEGAVSVQEIQSTFFHHNIDLTPYGVEGSAALWGTEPGINKVDITVDGFANLLFWDGANITPFVVNGTQELYFNTVSDEWGFIVLDDVASNEASVTFDNVVWYESQPDNIEVISYQEDMVLPDDWMIETLGDVEVDNTPNYNNGGNFMVGTGTGDRAVSTIGNNLMGDRNYFKTFGTEGSYLNISDIENGVYEFDVNQLGKIDSNNNDALYAWNGKQLTLIADNENGLVTNSVDVIYGELSFIGVDVNTKTGTTDFTITGLEKTEDLSYSPPTPISLMPDIYLGDVDFYEQQTRINNGSGDRAVSTLSRELNIDLSMYGTEGSYATWSDLENGIYEITYSLSASENDANHDNIYFYDGTNLNLFDSRSSATIQSSATRWISETKTQEVAVADGQLTFITLDTVDKSGTTQLRINGIERVNELTSDTNDPYSYIYEEPPFPMPDLGKDLGNDPLTGLNLGTLKPWETDSNTGTEYNQGYVYGSYHLGASYITETIGGDDVSDWIQFNLDESSYLNFYHNNAIAQILDENQQVIIGSDDGYSGNLQAYLNSGNYYIGFSSESSTSELFNASIYLSNSDPNYAD